MVDEAVSRFRDLTNQDAVPDGRFAILAHLLANNNITYSDLSVTILTVISDSILAVSALTLCWRHTVPKLIPEGQSNMKF